jgi:hypothetical protein
VDSINRAIFYECLRCLGRKWPTALGFPKEEDLAFEKLVFACSYQMRKTGLFGSTSGFWLSLFFGMTRCLLSRYMTLLWKRPQRGVA